MDNLTARQCYVGKCYNVRNAEASRGAEMVTYALRRSRRLPLAYRQSNIAYRGSAPQYCARNDRTALIQFLITSAQTRRTKFHWSGGVAYQQGLIHNAGSISDPNYHVIPNKGEISFLIVVQKSRGRLIRTDNFE